MLRPFLFGFTEHFLHELVSFARTNLDMSVYDRHVAYSFARNGAPAPAQAVAAVPPNSAQPPRPPAPASNGKRR